MPSLGISDLLFGIKIILNDFLPFTVETIQTHSLKHRIDKESGHCRHANARQASDVAFKAITALSSRHRAE